MVETTGYMHCSHQYCFTIIIGKPGDLCDDCQNESGDASEPSCAGCDHE